jgi:DNA ligase (NAD+)
VERLVHFCSRDAVNIEGLGPAKLKDLYDAGIIKTPLDIFLLRTADLAIPQLPLESNTLFEKDWSEQVVSGESLPLSAPRTSTPSVPTLSMRGRKGWGDRSVNNVLTAIDERRELPFYRFLFSLGIRHVGVETAKDLSNKFISFNGKCIYAYTQKLSFCDKYVYVSIVKTCIDIYEMHQYWYMLCGC